MFYHTVVASALSAAVCWGGSLTEKSNKRLDKLVEKEKAGSVLSKRLDMLRFTVWRRKAH